ncbi:hypothetical protein L6452_36475 [Arctium lappa]|uniref:Uncharacterized protein n=1 Tax=Arctium lappa TaxID=4217 RepID=A0ACB8Y8L3_ARCLA|nr:hypothetical protein L6452_36475 [Arctium lappa]
MVYFFGDNLLKNTGTSAEKASLSLKSVQSQSEESKSVSEVSSESVSKKASLSLKSVQRQSHGKTSESSSSEILFQSSEDVHSEFLTKKNR